MRFPALLLFIWLVPTPVQSQGRNSASIEYGPDQVLNVLRLLREQRGDPNPPKLTVCLKNSSDGRWSDLQAHFYCWLKPDQRACFTGAVDGEFKEHPELKGNYDAAFGHCQEAKGRAYGINFDRPMARFTVEQSEVFKNLLYRQPMFSKVEQRKILEAFYKGAVPERKPFPAHVPPVAVKPAPAAPESPKAVAAEPAKPIAAAPVKTSPPTPHLMASAPTMVNPDMGEMENAVPPEGFPRTCQVKSNHARIRLKPDSNSTIVAILDPSDIKVIGPAQGSTGADKNKWYPVELQNRGKIINAWLAVSLVDCPNL